MKNFIPRHTFLDEAYYFPVPSLLDDVLPRPADAYVWSAEEFELMVGWPPNGDDLERINCVEGKPLHLLCGVCGIHLKPRFVCGCLEPGEVPGARYLPYGSTRTYLTRELSESTWNTSRAGRG